MLKAKPHDGRRYAFPIRSHVEHPVYQAMKPCPSNHFEDKCWTQGGCCGINQKEVAQGQVTTVTSRPLKMHTNPCKFPLIWKSEPNLIWAELNKYVRLAYPWTSSTTRPDRMNLNLGACEHVKKGVRTNRLKVPTNRKM